MFLAGFHLQGLAAQLAGGLSAMRDTLNRRAMLLRGKAPAEAHRPPLKLFLAEAGYVIDPVLRAMRGPIPIARSANPRVVLLLPGFAASERRMRYMAQQLERAGHKVKRWGLGFNLGPTEENLDQLAERLRDIHARHGQAVYLVGWSLGGLFAREMAHRHPECVAKVVTMGTPFGHTPWSNNIWRAYQFVAGHRVETPPVPVNRREKPPVETVALWSPRDGVISARSASGAPGERDRAVALRCSHLGFCTDPGAIRAVLRELE